MGRILNYQRLRAREENAYGRVIVRGPLWAHWPSPPSVQPIGEFPRISSTTSRPMGNAPTFCLKRKHRSLGTFSSTKIRSTGSSAGPSIQGVAGSNPEPAPVISTACFVYVEDLCVAWVIGEWHRCPTRIEVGDYIFVARTNHFRTLSLAPRPAVATPEDSRILSRIVEVRHLHHALELSFEPWSSAGCGAKPIWRTTSMTL